MLNLKRRCNLVCLLAGTALFASQESLANVLAFDGFTWGSVTTTVAMGVPLDAPVGGNSLATGGFNVHVDAGNSFQAWCIDVWQWLAGSNYTYQSSILGTTVDAGKVNFTQAKIDNLSRLATEAYGSINNATTSAAFQAAVWEIAFENSASYNLTSGAFTMSAPAAVTQQAATWLNGIGNYAPGAYSVSAWTSPTQQDVLVFTHVPEPGTLVMILAGLGLLGYRVRSRNDAGRFV
jgi:hypothetical protein